MQEDDLWDMSDDELEAAFKAAQASEDSPETDFEADAGAEEAPAEELDVDDNEEVIDDEEDVDGFEQPEGEDLEDSDQESDNSDDSEEADVDEEDGEDTEEDNLDEDSSKEEEPSSENTDTTDEKPQTAQSYKFRANGRDYEFSSEEIVDQFPKVFGQAMDYTKKMQTIKPWRKTIDAIESAELGHEDVSLMIDVLKGDKGAIAEVLKRTNTDAFELEGEDSPKYVANDYGRDESALDIKDIVDDISRDAEYSTTHRILSNEWDDKSWEAMTEDPNMIKLLHTDVKTGMYDTIQPIAEKLKVFDGGSKSDLDYYREAARQHFTQVAAQDAQAKQAQEQETATRDAAAEAKRLAQAKAQKAKRAATKKASTKRKAAAPTKSAAPRRDVVDYLDDSEEAFEEWYQKLQDSM